MPVSDKKVAIVTGASAGIGKSVVRTFLADGWTVYGLARRVPQMQDILSEGAKVIGVDLTDDAATTAAVQQILDAEGRIDALINNAGYGSHGPVELVPTDEARRQFEVNVFAVTRLSQLVIPAMRSAGRGTIVNIGSIAGRMWMPFGGWYHATKYSLECLSDAMRLSRPSGSASSWFSLAQSPLNGAASRSTTCWQIPGARLTKSLHPPFPASSPEKAWRSVRIASPPLFGARSMPVTHADVTRPRSTQRPSYSCTGCFPPPSGTSR